MITEHRAEKLHAGVANTVEGPQSDVAVGVLEITGCRSRAEIYPAAEIRMSDETFLSLVGVAEYDGAGDLTADLGDGTDRAACDVPPDNRRSTANSTRA